MTTISLILAVIAFSADQWSSVRCSTDDLSVDSDAVIDETTDDELSAGSQSSDADQSILYSTPNIDNYYIYEHFDDDQDFQSRWIRSEASKADSNEFKYDGEWSLTQTTPSLKGLFRRTDRLTAARPLMANTRDEPSIALKSLEVSVRMRTALQH